MTDQFEEKSKDWDERPGPVQISEAVGKLLDELDWDASMRVMDFGAGTGLVAAHVAPRVSKVVAVDVSPSMLEALAAKPELQGRVETRCQDILESPLNESFGAIISAKALHHVEDTEALAARFAEHLKPGGFVALADLDSEDGTFYIHANVRFDIEWLKPLIVTPRFHHWHHGVEKEAIDVNFAIHFPIFDRLFGTYHMPAGRWPEGYGVGGHPVPPGFIRQFLYPFRRKS